jgi:hypothetical protein
MASIGDWMTLGSERSAMSPAGLLGKHLASFILPLLAIVVLALISWASVTYDIPIPVFTRDMAVLAKLPPYVSVASSLGAFLMCATATVCLFAFAVARAQSVAVPATGPAHLLAAGVFSLYLATDDFYEFHERVFPNFIGIDQRIIYALIASAAALLLFRWRREFLAFRPWLLLSALACLAFSIACDVFDTLLLSLLRRWEFLLEDGAKLVGISLWATYFMAMARNTLVANPAQGAA